MKMTGHETLILGIGNTLLTDEGAGIHALNMLQEDYFDYAHLTFLDGGTLSFTLAAWIEDCDNLIVFDATQLGQPAGTVRSFVGEKMDEFLGTSKRSAHEVGLLDLMDIARITEHLPQKRALIGIQPEQMGWGMQPTPVVQKALSLAVDTSKELIEKWHSLTSR
jgi:hydrogenase maturation protease